MYYRLYASKTNTIFRYNDDASPFNDGQWSVNTNTGNNTIMELYDGKGVSKLLFGFEIPQWIKDKLAVCPFNANLRIFDAGAIYEPVLPLKDVTLDFFPDDFAEGDGWSFNKGNNLIGVSNWRFRQDGQPWDNTVFTSVGSYHLNKFDDDLSFNVNTVLTANIANPVHNFALSVLSPVAGPSLQAKFFYSNKTRTVFQPYLEFVIQDEVVDRLYDMQAGRNNKLYFVNENNINFSGDVTAKVTLNDNTIANVTATKERDGVFYITINPLEPGLINKKEYVTVIWAINARDVYKQTVLVKPQNQFVDTVDYKNLFFYPSTPYTHNIVRQGDVIPFEVISQIRGVGDVVQTTYEYRVVSADGFEMVPWTQVGVYRNKMYFNLNTLFLYPELSYEVFLRNNQGEWSITANTTFKFKLTTNAYSHLRELSATPYFSREIPFSK